MLGMRRRRWQRPGQSDRGKQTTRHKISYRRHDAGYVGLFHRQGSNRSKRAAGHGGRTAGHPA